MVFEDGATLIVRGEGGAVFPMDVPATGTVRREIFDDHIEKGWLTIISDDPESYDPDAEIVAPDAEPEPVSDAVAVALELVDEVPDGNVDEVLSWAEDDADRQLAALMVEQGEDGKGRKGVVESLTSALTPED